MEINKVIIPAAGLGTRFLPLTKALPKEMLPLLNKPAIQYIVEECIHAGLQQLLLITNKDKQIIANYFDKSPELEAILQEHNKEALLDDLKKIARLAQFTFIRQSEPLGLGHAIWTARNCINPKEYFGVILPDDIIVAKDPAIKQLMAIARQEKASVIAVQEVPPNAVSSYGIIAIKKQITTNLFQVNHLVEKPAIKDAPSQLAVVGRYILSPKVFDALGSLTPYASSELQLTDGISLMLKGGEKVFAYKLQGTRYDIGTPVGWLSCCINMALQDPHYAPHIKAFLSDSTTHTACAISHISRQRQAQNF